MFFVLFVLPQIKKRGQHAPAPAGPGGGIVDTPNGSILPAPGNSGGTAQNGDWIIEEVDIGGTKPASKSSGVDMDNFGKGGSIKLPSQNPSGLPSGITFPDGRTPGFNPNPIDTTVDLPGTPDKTQKGDWSIEEVETTKPSSGVTIKPVGRVTPNKSTKGDWTIETE